VDSLSPLARDVYVACLDSAEFEVVEIRELSPQNGGPGEIIVVRCINDQVPSRNAVGIRAREEFAIVVRPNSERPPEVRPLRLDFPATLHQNETSDNEPLSLCLYFEPWKAVKRSWTPQKFLSRILWWLTATAKGELHRHDQPVEQLYFDADFKIVLPPNGDEDLANPLLELSFTPVRRSDHTTRVFRARFVQSQGASSELRHYLPLVLTLPPVAQSRIRRFPSTLGSLHDDLMTKGVDLLRQLSNTIRERTPTSGVDMDSSIFCLVVIRTPIQRDAGSAIERTEVKAALIAENLGSLGVKLGTLFPQGNRAYAVQLLAGTENEPASSWRSIEVSQVEIKQSPTPKLARASAGLSDAEADFGGALAGVGALGSAVLEIWTSEGWGRWSILDPDMIEPHNVVRHVSKERGIGMYKVDVVKAEMEARYPAKELEVDAIAASAVEWTNSNVRGAITDANLFVDATTTLEVPREWSLRADAPRSVSIFLTPSGKQSVLIAEDSPQSTRLDALEMQYYRAVLGSDWGKAHLTGHFGHLWVGAGCRDVSQVVAIEDVRLHAALLAREVRLVYAKSTSAITVWAQDADSVRRVSVSISKAYEALIDEWRVVWDEGTAEKLRRIRSEHLPNETGGVIVGYIDHEIESIYIVDVLPPTKDSKGDTSGFVRGVEGLNQELERIRSATANVVDYIGEWHSHPPKASALPSTDDLLLVSHLSRILAAEGEPALMLIVGERELSVIVK
jgi:integrative and conjugative element protein (TIGR02256 family)